MKIGLTGDTHNNLKNIEIICGIFNSEKVDLAIHTGDITLPKSLDIFSILEMSLIGVFGNNDQGDKMGLQEICTIHNFEFVDGIKKLSLKNKEILIVHDPLELNKNHYLESDMIFHGHTHRYRDEIKENCPVFNPGECAGFLNGKNNIGIIDVEKQK